MKEDFLDDLPLFINNSEPIGVYVVANKLLSFEETPLINNSNWLAYHFLGRLVKNQLTKGAIPKQIIQFHQENFEKIHVPWPCLTGIVTEFGSNRCLAAKMTLKKGIDDKVVHLHDFALLRLHGMDISVNDLQLDVYLTAEEAFLLFANINLSTHGHGLYRGWTENERFDVNEVKLQILDNYNDYFTNETSTQFRSCLVKLFCADYVEYLHQQFSKQTISPATILRLSGSEVLGCILTKNPLVQSFIQETITKLLQTPQTLTFNQKISYYTLYKTVEHWVDLTDFIDLSQKQKLFLDSIFKEHTKKFPSKFPYSLINRDEVYKNYLGRRFDKSRESKKK